MLITDDAFEKAQRVFAQTGTDEDLKEFLAEFVAGTELSKSEAHDFPVTEILSLFYMAHYYQEEQNGVPKESRICFLDFGRKTQTDYEQYFAKWKEKHKDKDSGFIREVLGENSGLGIGAKLLGSAVKLGAKGIARAVTGKSGDTRAFEKTFATTLCGNSLKAKEYLLKYASKFSGDSALWGLALTIMREFWMHELEIANRAN